MDIYRHRAAALLGKGADALEHLADAILTRRPLFLPACLAVSESRSAATPAGGSNADIAAGIRAWRHAVSTALQQLESAAHWATAVDYLARLTATPGEVRKSALVSLMLYIARSDPELTARLYYAANPHFQLGAPLFALSDEQLAANAVLALALQEQQQRPERLRLVLAIKRIGQLELATAKQLLNAAEQTAGPLLKQADFANRPLILPTGSIRFGPSTIDMAMAWRSNTGSGETIDQLIENLLETQVYPVQDVVV